MPDAAPIATTILLLVSDPLVRAVAQEILAAEGYMVHAVGTLSGALEEIRRNKPDLLITRTHIESLTGHDAAMYLRSKCNKMKVLIVGGILADDRLRNRELLEGFEVFPPPYPASDLLRKVKEVLSTPRG